MRIVANPREYKMFRDFDLITREEPPILALKERMSNSLVEIGYNQESAEAQGRRCLKCHINTIFDGDLCILCGGCVDVCPYYCLKMVPISQIDGDENLKKVVEARYQMSWEEIAHGDHAAISEVGTAMIKDEDKCIRCGLCAKRCPTGAVSMEFFDYVEKTEEIPQSEH